MRVAGVFRGRVRVRVKRQSRRHAVRGNRFMCKPIHGVSTELQPRISCSHKAGLVSVEVVRSGEVVVPCIGSGETIRDAKACAIKNLKKLAYKVKRMGRMEVE
jgi:hypothetical protein